MIVYALAAGGSAGALVLAWQSLPRVIQRLAPAGSGLHRYAKTPGQLRAELARSDRENEDLACALTTVSNDRDRAVRTAWAWRHAAHMAADRVGELAEQAREVPQLREDTRALRAQLANATAVSQAATFGDDDPTVPGGIPIITGAPYASKDPGRIRV
ncbi:hypothetical protein ACFY1J_31120 [Streptomyces sp. NPDC001406]|uniref:hypothetical protein n=1 Tax=Streptomyces sp. NPDC001406 TaxID=3364572 RepID=UPI00368DCBCA